MCLLIPKLGIKPVGAMKMLSRMFTFKILLSIAVAALTVVVVRAFAQGTPRSAPAERALTLKFKEAELKDDTGNTFKSAVRALKGEQFSVRVKHSNGNVEEVMPATGASIKIDKVTTSELARSSDAEFTAIGTHVTQTVTSASKAEIQSVLDTLK